MKRMADRDEDTMKEAPSRSRVSLLEPCQRSRAKRHPPRMFRPGRGEFLRYRELRFVEAPRHRTPQAEKATRSQEAFWDSCSGVSGSRPPPRGRSCSLLRKCLLRVAFGI